ncbi:MAG: histidinol-phosphatase [Cyclobacteriaceae bacterium]|nr:histidinol-phosphatase [Cyclobacteriaceae bacterium]
MKYWLYAIIIFIVGCSGSQEASPTENWQKGNLHTHTLWSDGDDYPEMVISWYKKNGYNFLALSDHNTFQDNEMWVPVTKSPQRIRAFENYLKEFGEDWVVSREDSAGTEVKLKSYSEFGVLQDSSFILIRGEEITNRFEDKPIHINASNLQKFVEPQTGESVLEVMQKVIDEVNTQRNETGVPMFPHINHPNFGWGISLSDMVNLNGERFFEVYNGHPAVNNYGDVTHLSTEEMWDQINLAYIRDGKPLMYGIATDDSHNYHMMGAEFSNSGRGWVMVNSKDLSPNSLIESMEKGNFYASSGVELENFIITKNEYSFSIKGREELKYTVRFIGAMNGDTEITILKETEGINPSYTFTGNEQFVRAVVTSNELQVNPFQIGDFEKAWTQPIIPLR